MRTKIRRLKHGLIYTIIKNCIYVIVFSTFLLLFLFVNNLFEYETDDLTKNDNENSYSERWIYDEPYENMDKYFVLTDDNEWRLKDTVYKNKRKNNGTEDLNCSTVRTFVSTMSFMGSGWTKAVYKSKHHNKDLAVKIVDIAGQDIQDCLEKQKLSNLDICYRKAGKKIIKEIVLLNNLQHENIVKVVGYCIPKYSDAKSNQYRLAIVTELGETVNLIKLLQLSWEDRLRVVYSMSKLLKYLASHHLGSLVMNDMRRQQFIIVDGLLKLVDVDDIGTEEPKCKSIYECQRAFESVSDNVKSYHIECHRGHCKGYNEIRNIYNAARHFVAFLLPFGSPRELQFTVATIVDAYKTYSLSSGDLLEITESLVKNYSNGNYLSLSNESKFIAIPQSDLKGLHDYSCHGSKSQIGCIISVVNVREAENLCLKQRTCKAFVWTNEKTWTGRNIVHFKNNISTPVKNENTTLYLNK